MPESEPPPQSTRPPAAVQAEPKAQEPVKAEEQAVQTEEHKIDDTGIIEEQPAQIAEADLFEEIPAEEETPLLDEIETAQTVSAEEVPLPPVPPAAQIPPRPEQIEPVPLSVIEPEKEIETAQEPPVPDEPPYESSSGITEVPRESYRPNFPSGPSHAPDSLLQMGLTPLDREIIYSRIIHATVGQIVEIPFRGTGWIYLGEIASRRGVVYSSRRNDPEGQSFIFTLEGQGTFTLKFYRQDFIRDYIINDHVQVVVTEAPAGTAGWPYQSADRGRIIAQPRWPSALEEAQIRSGSRIAAEPAVTTGEAFTQESVSPPSQGTTQTQSARAAPSQPAPSSAQSPVQPVQPPAAAAQPPAAATQPSQPSSPAAQTPSQTAPPAMTSEQSPAVQTAESQPSAVREKLPYDGTIQKAKENFESANPGAAISLLEQLTEDYPGGSDEIYWLLGQYYEANTPSRNILLSVDYYRRLVNEYPQSSRYNDARRRIAYLERFYINIQ
ncbi:MAG: hypothetical protein FWB77_05365 [Treponema sp.]|nr:hypothetical protein [Treponema sp.]